MHQWFLYYMIRTYYTVLSILFKDDLLFSIKMCELQYLLLSAYSFLFITSKYRFALGNHC